MGYDVTCWGHPITDVSTTVFRFPLTCFLLEFSIRFLTGFKFRFGIRYREVGTTWHSQSRPALSLSTFLSIRLDLDLVFVYK